MKRIFPFILILFFLGSCVVKKKTTYAKERKITVEASSDNKVTEIDSTVLKAPTSDSPSSKANDIINTALTYSGVRYKYGGTTSKGMDCSGLLYVSFKEHDIPIPRISNEMANEGKRIRVNQVEKGDLLFFKTTRKGKKINHVGLVVAVEDDEIKFIHASTSRGVIVSSLREGYWNYAFVKATRIL
ncbi:MAG: C40 family peptidase [Maribacter sp.]|nr:C40 family peptidase [Maribacter sp.]MBT8314700.1 C40 family peptidase [Maribacter sp.]